MRLIADKLVVDDDELKQELLAPGNSFRGRGSSPAGSSTNKHQQDLLVKSTADIIKIIQKRGTVKRKRRWRYQNTVKSVEI